MKRFVFVVTYDNNIEASTSVRAKTRDAAWGEIIRRANQFYRLRSIVFYKEYAL